jgi:ribosomal protein L24E
MTVPQHDHLHLQRDGTLWWCCSIACREEFARRPRPLRIQLVTDQAGDQG